MRPGKPSAHASALLAAVEGVLDGFAAFLDEVPKDPPYPYVVVWSDAALGADESLGEAGERSTFHPAWTIAARSATSVRTVRDDLDALFDDPPVVDGRLIELERLSSTQIARDDDLATPIYWCRDTLEMRSYAA